MLRSLLAVIVIFYIPMTIVFILNSLNSGNEFMTERFTAVIQVVEAFNFIFLLVIFRPRK